MNFNFNNKNKKDRITFRDLWKNPFYNSLFKLLFWAFFIIFIGVFISSGTRRYERYFGDNKNTEKSLVYSQMKTNLLNSPLKVIYTIGDYYITGTIIDNELDATVETSDNKVLIIKYDGENLYQLSIGNKTIDNELLGEINIKYLLPKNIFDITEDPEIVVEKSEDEKTYNYNTDDRKIAVSIGDNKIDEINIIENNINYNLKYEIKNEK